MGSLRDLPGIDNLLNNPGIARLAKQHGAERVKHELREMQASIRTSGTLPGWATDHAAYAERVALQLGSKGFRPVFNLTGTIIHTNLGRSLLSKSLWQQLEPLVTQPVNLEYDLQAGQRGDRDDFVEERLCLLTGAEAATIVNNNAAALLLVLNTFAQGKQVPVSRGELIEIGGSFRLPELMTRAGCTLIEVGTTNRTHLRDFEAVAPQASMMLKVHPSNYFIDGFTHEVTAADLARLARQHNIPSCVDLGSGSLVDLRKFGLPHETTPRELLDQGVDVVTFSGDKLLGSVQAGLIVGNRACIEQIKRNPMKRALRVDKITLAALDATLKLYEEPATLAQNLPLLRILTATQAQLRERGEKIKTALEQTLDSGFRVDICPCQAQIGSGALPDQGLESLAVRIDHNDPGQIRLLAKRFRSLTRPVIGRISKDALWLDMLGAEDTDELVIVLRTADT